MFPRRWIHDPWRNMDVRRWEACLPASVTQAYPSPSGNAVPGGTVPVSSPGMSPRSQTDCMSGCGSPAPCNRTQTSTFAAISAIVTWGVRSVRSSSRYGNMRTSGARRRVLRGGVVRDLLPAVQPEPEPDEEPAEQERVQPDEPGD